MGSKRRDCGLLLIALVATAAFAVGCGDDDGGDSGDETVSAEEYVTAVCTSIGDMSGVLEDANSELQAVTEATPEEGRDRLIEFLGEAADAVETATGELEAAGVPDVEGGEEVAEAIPAAFGELQTAFDDAIADAEALPTDSEAEFLTEVQGIGSAFQDAASQIGESLNEVGENEELEAAAQDSEACSQL